MWTVQVSGEARADRATVWAWYEASDLAPTWDPLIERIESDDPIRIGGKGRNHPSSGPSAPFVYTEVTPLTSYTEVSSAPGATFSFTHVLTDVEPGRVRITHGAQVSGPLAGVYRRLMQARFERGMRAALDNLVQRVESGRPPGSATGQGSTGAR